VDQSDVEKLIGDLEIAVDRLRSLYEQYFMGIEKIEPTVARKDVDRRVYTLRKEQIRNTALRFRFHMLLQRYNTYQTYWQRICRDIENGTYKRHVIRAQRRFGAKRQSARPSLAPPGADRPLADELAELDREFAPAEMLADGDVELDEELPPASPRRTPLRPPPLSPRPAVGAAHVPIAFGRTPRPPAKTPRPPAPPQRPDSLPPFTLPAVRPDLARAAVPQAPTLRAVAPAPIRRTDGSSGQSRQPSPKPVDLPDDRVRQLYAQYVEAKRRQNESTAAVTYDAVARSLRESSAKLRQKLGREVDFEVVVKDGRAVLRPVVK
jgi:hypothetical protein